MAENGEGKKGFDLDLTINIPTILSILTIVCGVTVWINSEFSSIKGEQIHLGGKMALIEQRQVQSEREIEGLKTDTSYQLQQFRVEMREDLRDIKSSMNKIAEQKK